MANYPNTSPSRPDGQLYSALDPTTLFYDNFEGGSLDIVNSWTTGGTAPTLSSGMLTFSAGTTASTQSYMRTITNFNVVAVAFLRAGFLIKLETGAVTGNKRWWGIGIPNATPTTALPLTNGVVFETDNTTGALVGVVYSGGVRGTPVALTRPTDGGVHRYGIYYRTSKVYFEIDSVSVGSIDFPNPNTSVLPLTMGSVNASTGMPATAAVLTATLASMSDTARNNIQISDGTFSWRKLNVSSNGGARIEITPTTAGGLSAYHLVSAATTNATNIKNSAGQVFGWFIYNANAAARKVVFHNTAGTPTAGASVFFSIVIPPLSGANVEYTNGIAFSTGIGISTTTGLTDTDATAVAANDLVINIFYK